MHISKVTFTGTKVVVSYDSVNDAGKKAKHKVTNFAMPHPDLKKSLNMMKKHVKRVCELSEDYVKDLEVRTVSIKHIEQAEEMITKSVVTAVKPLSDNETPFIFSTPSSETEFSKELEKIVNETKSYIKSEKRLQSEMQFPKEEGLDIKHIIDVEAVRAFI